MKTFRIDDRRSLRHLPKNKRGEEISARSFRVFMLRLLERNKGVLLSSELEAAILRNYGGTFGPDDLRPMRGQRPKWKNTLDWAKATATAAGKIATRQFQFRKKKYTLIVLLLGEVPDPDLVSWVLKKRVRNLYLKRCKNCGEYSRLSSKLCGECGKPFPPPNRRVHRLPR